ncbi:hypothetical protein EON83_00070 [bacterium]|nr:MAG: hypothetical protein EON83_00070 [bacterium]
MPLNLTIEKLPVEELNETPTPDAAKQPYSAAMIGALLDNADASDLDNLDELDNGGETHYIPVSIKKRNGQNVRVFVKELDILDIYDVEAGRLFVKNQVVHRAPAREGKMGLALEFLATVHKRTRAGEYVALFTDALDAQRWMKRPNNKDLIAQIITAIYLVNPELSPQKKMAMAKSALS